MVRLFSSVPLLGRLFTPRYQSQGGGRFEGLALQNLQARLRLILSYYYSQLVAAVKHTNGPILVVATGNCDEGLSGYFTKYDCSSGDLNPIGSICKTDLRKFVRYMIRSNQLPDPMTSNPLVQE